MRVLFACCHSYLEALQMHVLFAFCHSYSELCRCMFGTVQFVLHAAIAIQSFADACFLPSKFYLH